MPSLCVKWNLQDFTPLLDFRAQDSAFHSCTWFLPDCQLRSAQSLGSWHLHTRPHQQDPLSKPCGPQLEAWRFLLVQRGKPFLSPLGLVHPKRTANTTWGHSEV